MVEATATLATVALNCEGAHMLVLVRRRSLLSGFFEVTLAKPTELSTAALQVVEVARVHLLTQQGLGVVEGCAWPSAAPSGVMPM